MREDFEGRLSLAAAIKVANLPGMMLRRAIAIICLLVPVVSRADLFDTYGQLTGKTVLMTPLPVADMSELPADKTNAITEIETEFTKQGIALIPDGPHFVILTTQRNSGVNSISLHGPQLAQFKSLEMIPPGVIHFSMVDPAEVLKIYAELSKRTILRPAGAIPMSPVRLKNTCPLTPEEAVYALETLFALNGVSIVRDGDKFAQVVPVFQRNMVVAAAPKPETEAKLLDPNKLPSIGQAGSPRPTSKIERDLAHWRKAFYDFIHYKPAPERPAYLLLELYATLTDKEAERSTNFDAMPISFRVMTPLTRTELLYAIETTFTLNWLGITNVDFQRIRLRRISERDDPPR